MGLARVCSVADNCELKASLSVSFNVKNKNKKKFNPELDLF